MIEPSAPPRGPEPEELKPALDRLQLVCENIKAGGTGQILRMPEGRSLDDFFRDLRVRDYDDVFTSENPGP